MGTITARKCNEGSAPSWRMCGQCIDGFTYHEMETFDRRSAASSWFRKRERELAMPGVIAGYEYNTRLRYIFFFI